MPSLPRRTSRGDHEERDRCGAWLAAAHRHHLLGPDRGHARSTLGGLRRGRTISATAEALLWWFKFHIDNPGIGTSLFDHVGTALAYEYVGSAPAFRAYHYGDYGANAADLAAYVAARSGPYAQYGPVSVMQHSLSLDPSGGAPQPNVEVFVNPFGAGAPGGPYNGPRYFSAYAVLLRPQARALTAINRETFVDYPPVYLTDEGDLRLMALAVQQLILIYRTNPDLILTFGPGGRSHPGLNPERFEDVMAYVAGWDPVDGVYYARLIMNHWGGTCPVGGGVDPATLRVDRTRNIHVVDASLHPAPLSAHPVATIMAVAEKASDILSGQIAGSA